MIVDCCEGIDKVDNSGRIKALLAAYDFFYQFSLL